MYFNYFFPGSTSFRNSFCLYFFPRRPCRRKATKAEGNTGIQAQNDRSASIPFWETTTSSCDRVGRVGMSAKTPNVLSDFHCNHQVMEGRKHPATPIVWVGCLLVLPDRETPDEAKAVRVQRKNVIFNLEKKSINVPFLAFSCFFNDWLTYAVLLFYFSIFALDAYSVRCRSSFCLYVCAKRHENVSDIIDHSDIRKLHAVEPSLASHPEQSHQPANTKW